jgi:hypothetical protein
MTKQKDDDFVWAHQIQSSRLEVWRRSAFNNLTSRYGTVRSPLPQRSSKGVAEKLDGH